MKRHLAILAFGLLVAGSVTYAQVAPQGVTNLASSSISQGVTTSTTSANTGTAKAAPALSIAKPSIAGGGESDD